MTEVHETRSRVALGSLAVLLAAAMLSGAGCATRQSVECLLGEVKLHNSLGEHDKAVECATRLIRLLEGNPGGETELSAAAGYFWRGYSYDLWKDKLRRGRRKSPDVARWRDAALGDYEKAIEKDADFIEAHFNAALIYYDENRFDEALRRFGKVEAISPAATEARAYMAEIYFRQGRFEEAAAAVDRMIAGGTREALEEAKRLSGEGRTEDAIEVLERSAGRFPDCAGTHRELGMLYLFRQKDMARALYHLEKYCSMVEDEETRRGIEKIIEKVRECYGD